MSPGAKGGPADRPGRSAAPLITAAPGAGTARSLARRIEEPVVAEQVRPPVGAHVPVLRSFVGRGRRAGDPVRGDALDQEDRVRAGGHPEDRLDRHVTPHAMVPGDLVDPHALRAHSLDLAHRRRAPGRPHLVAHDLRRQRRHHRPLFAVVSVYHPSESGGWGPLLRNVSLWALTDRDATTAGFHRLVAAPGTLTVAEVAPDLAGRGRARRDRPHVAINMVASVDGRATLDGRAGPLGDPADRALFRRLRTQVDAVMVGAGTLRAERYGPIISDPAVRAERRRRSVEADPWARPGQPEPRPAAGPAPPAGSGLPRHRDRRRGGRDRAVRGPGRVPARNRPRPGRRGAPLPPWDRHGALRGRAAPQRLAAQGGSGRRALSRDRRQTGGGRRGAHHRGRGAAPPGRARVGLPARVGGYLFARYAIR